MRVKTPVKFLLSPISLPSTDETMKKAAASSARVQGDGPTGVQGARPESLMCGRQGCTSDEGSLKVEEGDPLSR